MINRIYKIIKNTIPYKIIHGIYRDRNNSFNRLLIIGLTDFLTYDIMWLFSTIVYRFSEKRNLEIKNYVKKLSQEKVIIFNLENDLSQIWDRFDRYHKSPQSEPTVLLTGMLTSTSNIFMDKANQFRTINELNKQEIYLMQSFFAEYIEIIESVYKCSMMIYNIRVYRLVEGDSVKPHVDYLPPRSFKIMFFRGEISLENGALSAINSKGDLKVADGKSPLLIFEPNYCTHFSNMKKGYRDCIELSLAPNINKEWFQGGNMASHPINPFKVLKSKKAKNLRKIYSIYNKPTSFYVGK